MLRFLFSLMVVLSMLLSPTLGTAQDKIVYKVGMGDPLEGAMGAFAVRFKEIVEARSNGKVGIELFPSCQLGDESEMIQNVRSGNLDMAMVGIGNLVPFVKRLGIMTMPYLFENMEQVVKGTTGAAHDLLNSYAVKEGGFRIIGWSYCEYRFISNSKRPIKSIEDIKGLKFRVPNSAVFLESYKAWGANPVPVSWAETFTALQQGVVDGQCLGYLTFLSCKFNETQKYMTEVHYTYHLQPLILSNLLDKKMTPEHRQLILDAALEAQNYSLVYEYEQGAKAKAELIRLGMKVDVLTDEDKWKQAAYEKVWPAMANFVGGKDAINAFLAAAGKTLWQ